MVILWRIRHPGQPKEGEQEQLDASVMSVMSVVPYCAQ